MQRILVASGNAKKLHELRTLCSDLPVEIFAPADVNAQLPDVVEDGDTFSANARKKALEFADFAAEYLGPDVWALADDSGLSVDYLDGAPGVHSARFAGIHGDDEANNALLLKRLNHVDNEQRGAAFHCVIAVAHRGSILIEAEGQVRGQILRTPQGEDGFGYDPLFFHPLSGVCFAQLSMQQKAKVSHRGIAVSKLRQAIKSLLDQPQATDD
ncbi:MAG: non-canonical purine NTP pyrophosphatase [Planctomycetes bacterium]|nr:non-canonical purine NTP pyrophosphatase [Planctomycetota bacterium]